MANIGRLARDLTLDVVELADAFEDLMPNLGFPRSPDIVKIAPPMGKHKGSDRTRLRTY
jgi:hypothetical protein